MENPPTGALPAGWTTLWTYPISIFGDDYYNFERLTDQAVLFCGDVPPWHFGAPDLFPPRGERMNASGRHHLYVNAMNDTTIRLIGMRVFSVEGSSSFGKIVNKHLPPANAETGRTMIFGVFNDQLCLCDHYRIGMAIHSFRPRPGGTPLTGRTLLIARSRSRSVGGGANQSEVQNLLAPRLGAAPRRWV